MITRSILKRISLMVILSPMVLFPVLQSSLISPTAAAGSAPGELDCKSVGRKAGAITLAGQVPGDYEVFDLKIKSGKDEYAIKSLNRIDQGMDPEERTKLEENGVIANDRVITMIEDFNRGVFTLALRGRDRYDLRLYALPGTIRARIVPYSKKATFDAMLVEGDTGKKAVRMRCTYDHTV